MNGKKRILFIIQSFPSVRSANALCDEKIIHLLNESGEFEVCCLAYENYNLPEHEVINGINVFRFRRSLFWRLSSKARSKPSDRINQVIIHANRILLRLKQIASISIYPNTEPLLTYKCERAALQLHEKYHFDMVIAEHHGFDTLHAGSVLKKKYPEIKFVPILWDPFTGKEPAKYLPVRYANHKLVKAEYRELINADKIVAMLSSKSYHENNSAAKDYYDKFVFLDIPGIVEPQVVECKSNLLPEIPMINIVFAGILSLPDRDPEYIIKALALTSYAKKLNLIFVCIGEGKEKLKTLSKEFPGIITVSGYIGKQELSSIYGKADFLLNFGGTNPTMVPSKVFEYISYGKPIISTYYIDGEASLSYLEKYPLSICIDQRQPIASSAQIIEKGIKQMQGRHIPFPVVEAMFPDNAPKRYVEIIRAML